MQQSKSERRQTEEALRESEERLHFHTGNSPMAVIERDTDFVVRRWTGAAEKIFGWSFEEAMGKSIMELGMVYEEDMPIVQSVIQRLIDGRSKYVVSSTRNCTKDGEVIHCEWYNSVLHDSAGEIISVMSQVLDITERRHAEEKLRLHEMQFRTILESTCDGILAVDNKGSVIKANQKFADLWKIPADLLEKGDDKALLTHVLGQLLDPDEFLHKVQALYASTAVDFDTVLFKDGRVMERYSCPLLYEDVINGRVWSFRDITERKQAEETLKLSEEKFRLSFMTSLDAFYWSTLEDGKILEVNPVFEDVFGYARDEVIGRTSLELGLYVDPDDRARMLSELKANGHIKDLKLKGRKKSGKLITISLSVSKMLIHDQQYILGVIRDITERKQIEEELRKNQAQLRDAHRLAHIGVWNWIVDTDTVTWSDELYHIAGIDPMIPALTFAEHRNLYVPESWNSLKAAVEKALETDAPFQLELELIRTDGTTRWVNAFGGTTYDAEGRAIGLHGTVQDLTEHKRKEREKNNLEERLRNAEKMEIMGKMAGRVAHDLNNVLGVLSGYSELLEERLPSGDPLRVYAANIQKASGKAAAIVEDLLTLTRRGVRVMETSSLNKIIANLLTTPELDKLVAYHPHVIVTTNLTKDLLNINGSPVHLEKTIMNLVLNAMEAIDGSGEAHIQTENRYLDGPIQGYQTVKEGEYVVLTVSDTGKGIPVSELKNIFEPFYTKKSMGRSGTGLGLAIVLGTVQDHHGYIDVQSIEGEGSTFTLYFPATRERSEEETPKTPMEQYMGHGETVLVVDDIEEQRNVASALLMQLDYEVIAVSSGEEGVEYLKNNKADILVLDMIMEPGMDGLDTYKRILEINPTQKAIIVSGFSETERTKEAQKLGACAYIKKPYLKEKIGIAIRDELTRK